MTFSIFVFVNSLQFNNIPNDENGNVIRIPYKANPMKHYRQTTKLNNNKSSKNTHMVGFFNGIPGGTSKCILDINNNDETNKINNCQGGGIVSKIEIPKTKYILAQGDNQLCRQNCKDPEKIARNRVRQSNTTMKQNYFSRTLGYLQNRNKTYQRKTSNFLDRQESILLYGSYDKQQFFLRNSHTSGSLLGCASSFYKPTNTQFATNGGVYSSSLTGRKKYNVDNLCRTRVPTNDYSFGYVYETDRKRYKKKVCCIKPDPFRVTFEKLQQVVQDTIDDISNFRDILNDDNAIVELGQVIKTASGEYQVPIVIKRINLSELNETETINLIQFMREKFENNNINPDLAVQILGIDGIDYQKQFNNNGTRFYVEPDTLRVVYLQDVLKSPNAFIEKTGYVRIDNEKETTVIELELDGFEGDLDQIQINALKLYLENLYFRRYGIQMVSFEIIE